MKSILAFLAAVTFSSVAAGQPSGVADAGSPRLLSWSCTVPVYCSDTEQALDVHVDGVLDKTKEEACAAAWDAVGGSAFCSPEGWHCGEPFDWVETDPEYLRRLPYAKPSGVCPLPWKVRFEVCGCDGRRAWAIGEGCTYWEAYCKARATACRAANEHLGGARGCRYQVLRRPCCHRRR